jgi:hypothetical protein
MKDSTIIRIKVPANLYESVKEQLKLQEGKNDFGMPGSTTIKEKKYSSGDSKPKKKTESKKADSGKEKKAETKKDNAPKEEAKIPKDGMKKVKSKKLKLSELKKMYEILGEKIAKMEVKKETPEKGAEM